MSDKSLDMDSSCDCCKKIFDKKAILRHIGQSKKCKAFYGPRFKDMKTKQASERKENYRSNLSSKEHKRVLKRNRKIYASNAALKEKKKEANKERKIKEQKESKEKRKSLGNGNHEESEAGPSIKILYRTSDNFQELCQDPWVKCHFCFKKFDPYFILKHIAKSEDCKTFYGPKFDQLKKEKNRFRNNIYRRESYHTNLEVKEKKKQARKDKKDSLKQQRKKEFNKKWAEDSLEYKIRFFKERNSMGKRRFGWVEKCFEHFLDTFSQVEDYVRIEILDLVSSVEDTFQKNQKKIAEMTEKVKGSDHVVQVHSIFSCADSIIQRPWEKLEVTLDNKLKKIFAKIEKFNTSTEWKNVLENIYDSYKQKYTGDFWFHWKKGDYLPKPLLGMPCMICGKEPNCIEKPKKSESILCSFTTKQECAKKGCKECRSKL